MRKSDFPTEIKVLCAGSRRLSRVLFMLGAGQITAVNASFTAKNKTFLFLSLLLIQLHFVPFVFQPHSVAS